MRSPVPSIAPATPKVTRIGRFVINRELGTGTVGTVYLGHDPVIDRDLAIKTFSVKLTPTEKAKHAQHFINEARAAGRLSHPNIVTIYDASSEGGTTYIAMEYLQGRELSILLDAGHRFKPDDVATIVGKIAEALDYAHKNSVVHRDIKPGNIFMVGDSNPKIVDFGIARAPNRLPDPAGYHDGNFTIFQNNSLLGTPNYMSPEQAAGLDVDLRTDIYSLGAVMYEMLAGRKPFQSRDRTRLLQMIAHKALEAPHTVDPEVPVMLSHIVMKAMNKQPDKRYQHAEEMAHDLKRFLSNQKRSRQKSRSEAHHAEHKEQREKQPAPRNRSIFLVYFAILAAAGAAAVFYLR